MDDLKFIKNKYGENMMKLCRELFPILLEQPGLLSNLLLANFNPSKFLYDDIVEGENIEAFKNYIYRLVDVEKGEIKINKTVKELMDEAGYDLYECKSEEDIQHFKKYYAKHEKLCTFNGGRLDKCYVFFAVKKNVAEIKRENFKTPTRQDEYGTSVISIQFTKDSSNTLSIKNRYNHRVNNPDATFSNNLDNIIPGLTYAFEREYNLNLEGSKNNFELDGYVKANDGKYYKYNYEINNVYYCPNNIIIKDFEVIKTYEEQLERYIVLDYFILDLKNKTIELFDKRIKDCFTETIKDMEKIDIKKDKETGNKTIEITTQDDKSIIITLDKANNIVQHENNQATVIGHGFLMYSSKLKTLSMPNVRSVGEQMLAFNTTLTDINLSNAVNIGDYFLMYNTELSHISLESAREIGRSFMISNIDLKSVHMPNVRKIKSYFLHNNKGLTHISLPKATEIEGCFLRVNKKLRSLKISRFARMDMESYIRLKKIIIKNNIEELFAGFKIKLTSINLSKFLGTDKYSLKSRINEEQLEELEEIEGKNR